MTRLPSDSFAAIIVGPSGVGKNTIIDEMLKIQELPHLRLNKSWVTRRRRPHEKTENYVFVDESDFKKAQAEGRFIHAQRLYDHWYGTLWPEAVSENTIELFHLVAPGARDVKAHYKNAKIFLIEPPSLSELRKRLEGRGITDLSDLSQREHAAVAELKAGKAIADYRIVNETDKQVETAQKLHKLIREAWEAHSLKKPALK